MGLSLASFLVFQPTRAGAQGSATPPALQTRDLAVAAWENAKAAYERALKERPRSGFALYGIAISSEKAGDSKAAAKAYADFLAAWKNSDPTLIQMTHAQDYLAAHPVVAGRSERNRRS